MRTDNLAKNTPNAQFVSPSPKNLDFNEKRLHWASVVRIYFYDLVNCNRRKEFLNFRATFPPPLARPPSKTEMLSFAGSCME